MMTISFSPMVSSLVMKHLHRHRFLCVLLLCCCHTVNAKDPMTTHSLDAVGILDIPPDMYAGLCVSLTSFLFGAILTLFLWSRSMRLSRPLSELTSSQREDNRRTDSMPQEKDGKALNQQGEKRQYHRIESSGPSKQVTASFSSCRCRPTQYLPQRQPLWRDPTVSTRISQYDRVNPCLRHIDYSNDRRDSPPMDAEFLARRPTQQYFPIQHQQWWDPTLSNRLSFDRCNDQAEFLSLDGRLTESTIGQECDDDFPEPIRPHWPLQQNFLGERSNTNPVFEVVKKQEDDPDGKRAIKESLLCDQEKRPSSKYVEYAVGVHRHATGSYAMHRNLKTTVHYSHPLRWSQADTDYTDQRIPIGIISGDWNDDDITVIQDESHPDYEDTMGAVIRSMNLPELCSTHEHLFTLQDKRGFPSVGLGICGNQSCNKQHPVSGVNCPTLLKLTRQFPATIFNAVTKGCDILFQRATNTQPKRGNRWYDNTEINHDFCDTISEGNRIPAISINLMEIEYDPITKSYQTKTPLLAHVDEENPAGGTDPTVTFWEIGMVNGKLMLIVVVGYGRQSCYDYLLRTSLSAGPTDEIATWYTALHPDRKEITADLMRRDYNTPLIRSGSGPTGSSFKEYPNGCFGRRANINTDAYASYYVYFLSELMKRYFIGDPGQADEANRNRCRATTLCDIWLISLYTNSVFSLGAIIQRWLDGTPPKEGDILPAFLRQYRKDNNGNFFTGQAPRTTRRHQDLSDKDITLARAIVLKVIRGARLKPKGRATSGLPYQEMQVLLTGKKKTRGNKAVPGINGVGPFLAQSMIQTGVLLGILPVHYQTDVNPSVCKETESYNRMVSRYNLGRAKDPMKVVHQISTLLTSRLNLPKVRGESCFCEFGRDMKYPPVCKFDIYAPQQQYMSTTRGDVVTRLHKDGTESVRELIEMVSDDSPNFAICLAKPLPNEGCGASDHRVDGYTARELEEVNVTAPQKRRVASAGAPQKRKVACTGFDDMPVSNVEREKEIKTVRYREEDHVPMAPFQKRRVSSPSMDNNTWASLVQGRNVYQGDAEVLPATNNTTCAFGGIDAEVEHTRDAQEQGEEDMTLTPAGLDAYRRSTSRRIDDTTWPDAGKQKPPSIGLSPHANTQSSSLTKRNGKKRPLETLLLQANDPETQAKAQQEEDGRRINRDEELLDHHSPLPIDNSGRHNQIHIGDPSLIEKAVELELTSMSTRHHSSLYYVKLNHIFNTYYRKEEKDHLDVELATQPFWLGERQLFSTTVNIPKGVDCGQLSANVEGFSYACMKGYCGENATGIHLFTSRKGARRSALLSMMHWFFLDGDGFLDWLTTIPRDLWTIRTENRYKVLVVVQNGEPFFVFVQVNPTVMKVFTVQENTEEGGPVITLPWRYNVFYSGRRTQFDCGTRGIRELEKSDSD